MTARDNRIAGITRIILEKCVVVVGAPCKMHRVNKEGNFFHPGKLDLRVLADVLIQTGGARFLGANQHKVYLIHCLSAR